MPCRQDIKKILLIGSGPIVIGQACEFDYSGTQGAKALTALGYDVVLVNSNPATIMTDPDLVRRTYIEPLDVDHLSAIIQREKPDALLASVADGGLDAVTIGYGVGNYHLYNGRRDQATTVFRQVVDKQPTQWPAFGYIAAEAELAATGMPRREN